MKLEIYKDKKNEWRWRLKARNGRIVATCSEGYKTKQGLENTLGSINLHAAYNIFSPHNATEIK